MVLRLFLLLGVTALGRGGEGGAVADQCGPREVSTRQVCAEAISPSSFLEAGSYLLLPVELLARTEEFL